MKFALNTPARKWLVAVAACLIAVAYLGLTGREVVASWLGGRSDLRSLKMAAWLDPGNADYRNHVGRYYDLVSRDPLTAIEQFREAAQLNPHSARFWFDLAAAYQVLGDTPNQTAALEHAIAADPTTPDVAWEAANLYLVQGENEKALREFHVVLGNDSSLATAAIQFCWRISPDVDALLRDVVPGTAEAYIPFLGLLETRQETAGSMKVWDALIRTRASFERRYAAEYFQYLVTHKEVDEAMLVWRQTADRFGLSSYLPSASNLMVNGTFEFDPLNAGLDWRHDKQQGVQLTLDPSQFHAGRRSLAITFDGPGINDAGFYQYVALQPNTTYQFSAYYKNAGELEGAGGPHFTVQDMYTQQIYFQSDELRDAGFWKPVEGEFTTGADCKLVVVRVRRLPGGYPIRGKLWIDDFRLAKKTN